MIMRRVPKDLQVYNPDTPFSSAPDEIVPYDEGRSRVERGFADLAKHGKAIRMRRGAIVLRASSLECRKDLVETFNWQGRWLTRSAPESFSNEEAS
jgi:hypothetical protein